jgi:hypothetical protein
MNRIGWRIATNILFGSGGMAVFYCVHNEKPAIGFIVLLIFNFLGYWAMDNYAKAIQGETV